MSLDEMYARGELRRLPPRKDEPVALLAAARRRLEDAANPSVHPETRLEQAYAAILNCAMAALRAEGYRVARGPGQHTRTLETLRYTVGIPEQRIDYYQILRSLRHKELYEGLADVSLEQVEEAVKEAARLVQETQSWLAKRYPRLFPAP